MNSKTLEQKGMTMKTRNYSPFIGCAALLLAGVLAARADDPDNQKAVEPWSLEQREVVQAINAYLDAWNDGDAERMAALCTLDCERIGGRGQKLEGRSGILEHYRTAFATPPPEGVTRSLAYEITSVRMVSDHLAIVDARYRVIGLGPIPDRPFEGLNTVVLVKENGKWLRTAHRNWIPARPETLTRDSENTGAARNAQTAEESDAGSSGPRDTRFVSGQPAEEERFKAPRIWDEQKLAGWSLPRGHQGLHQNYVTPEAYYGSPAYNTRTYPVYDPRKEPDGYWEWLHTLEPEPLVEPGVARSRDEWVRLGRDAFDQIDQVGFRMDDPEIIDFIRDPAKISEENTTIAADGTIPRFRWVVESRGRVRLSVADCSACHVRVMPDGSKLRGAPGNQLLGGPLRAAVGKAARENFLGPEFASMSPGDVPYALFGVPWLPDDRHAALKDMTPDELRPVQSAEIPGTFPRTHGSPFWTTRIRDLRGVKHRPFLDATATHLNREPADIARYAATVMYAGIPASYGGYETFPASAPRPLYHIEDDVLFALAMFLYSLEPAEDPMKNQLAPALVARGRQVFEQEDCARCHKPPDYSGDKLMPVVGYEVPEDHPLKDQIRRGRIDTDPGLALKTRKGTGLYKIPSLRGLWYRGLFGHDGSVSSLDDWFDPRRLEEDYMPTGWKGPGVEHRAVPGHEYGLDLPDEDKRALIAFLKTL